MFHKIKSRIIVFMLILALLPLIITGLVSNYILDSMRNELTTVTEQMGRIQQQAVPMPSNLRFTVKTYL